MRKTKIGILGALLSIVSLSAFGQTPTVTNADLEKYRQQRLKAERDLRENYEELGFPSPEELLRAETKSRRERAAIVSDLRDRDVAEARAEREALVRTYSDPSYYYPNPEFAYPNSAFVDYGGRYAPAYYYYYFRGFDRYPNRYRKEPKRFRTFRRMWRNATRGNTITVPRRRR